MTTLGEFHALVSAEINRGTSQDSKIPNKVKEAARWMERNYNLEYMEQFSTSFNIFATQQSYSVASHILTATTSKLKRIEFIRGVGADDDPSTATSLWYIEKVRGDSFDTRTSTQPKFFWLVGDHTLRFGQTATQDYSLEVSWWEHKAWSTSTDSTHWLIDNAEDVLMAQSMLFLMPTIRLGDREERRYTRMRDEGIRTMTLANDELMAGAEIPEMRFGRSKN